VIVTVLGSLLTSAPALAETLPASNKVANVKILKGPELEMAFGDLAIVRWTTNNPGGSPQHFAVIDYGTDPQNLDHTAKSPIELNFNRPEVRFRVRISGLKPQTTYYYVVSSTESNGKSDGVRSAINHFKTPAAGVRILNFPQPR
jgi:hypothetical protein